jgi:8-oxo-dGTP pyrophosphatase MutT (NUDIX family)
MTDSSSGERHQYGALPYKRSEDGTLSVFLVTSRDSGRWTIPKGNPMPGKKPHRTAAIEALEESGLIGTIEKTPLGSYVFWKRMSDHFDLATVTVFPLAVKSQQEAWKERDVRKVEAFPAALAATLVAESGLTQLIELLAERLDGAPVAQGGPRKDKPGKVKSDARNKGEVKPRRHKL